VIDGYTNSDVTDRVNEILTQAGISTSDVTTTQTPSDCTTVQSTDNPNTVSVNLSVPYNKVSWLGTPFLFQTATVTASATMSSERP
jgi:hypothetical protein